MFRDDVDRTDFCVRLARVIRKHDWVCHSFVLMPTHYHLLLEVDDNMLQPGMQRLNGTYAQAFNRRWGRWGHLRGDRYSAKPVESDGHFLGCVRYIARNPVEAGLCALRCRLDVEQLPRLRRAPIDVQLRRARAPCARTSEVNQPFLAAHSRLRGGSRTGECPPESRLDRSRLPDDVEGLDDLGEMAGAWVALASID